MNPRAIYARFANNKHTSAAAVIYAIAAFGCPIVAVWWPGHDSQLDTTRRTLEALAVFYGLSAAGDASATPSSPAVPQPQPTVTKP